MAGKIALSLGLIVALGMPLPAEEPAARERYTGEPVSLNLKEVDLLDFFRLIHELSGLNIVVGPDVRGTVTLVLIDVPWDQALDLVLRNHGLSSELEGNVLRIVTRERARQEAEALRQWREKKEQATPLQTVACRLSYARAREAAAIIERFLSMRGELAVDERTNSLLITDTPSVLRKVAGGYPACSSL